MYAHISISFCSAIVCKAKSNNNAAPNRKHNSPANIASRNHISMARESRRPLHIDSRRPLQHCDNDSKQSMEKAKSSKQK